MLRTTSVDITDPFRIFDTNIKATIQVSSSFHVEQKNRARDQIWPT